MLSYTQNFEYVCAFLCILSSREVVWEVIGKLINNICHPNLICVYNVFVRDLLETIFLLSCNWKIFALNTLENVSLPYLSFPNFERVTLCHISAPDYLSVDNIN